jgi:glycosyltransferase involved in cell wall biosynthesis
MEANESVDATVVITSKDRKEELRVAVESAVNQTANIEVLVIDDGSSDGTAEMIRSEFPSVRFYRKESSAGLVVRRNQAAELARAPILISIDDDAEFSTDHVVEQVLPYFQDDRVGAVGIPFIDVKVDPDRVSQKAPDASSLHALFSYIGTAHAIRKDLFLQLGGYRGFFIHQNEEIDFCIRMLDAGKIVVAGHGDHVIHYKSPKRDDNRYRIYKRRNDILFAWCNVPHPFLLPHIGGTMVNGLVHAVRDRLVWATAVGMWQGLKDSALRSDVRNPVRRQTYRLFRTLKKEGMMPVEEIEQSEPTFS